MSDTPTIILHLSDLHFNGNEDICDGIDRENIFDSLITKIQGLGDAWKPNVVCITGDIASYNKQEGSCSFEYRKN